MAQLLDQFGNPVPKSQLTREIAGADPSKFRQVWTGMYQSQGLTPERVAGALRAADSGHEMPWLHLAEEMEEKDGHYAAILGVRKRSVAGLPATVEAAGEDEAAQSHAAFIRDWLDTGGLDTAIYDLLDALSKGFSVHEIEWDSSPQRVWPRRLVYRSPWWFGVDRMDGNTVALRDGMALTPLPPWKFIVHKYQNKSGHLIRGGLARVAVWTWMFKAFTMKDWSIFTQNYGQPIRLGRYGAEATEDNKRSLWEAVSNIAGDMAAIIPKGMELEFVGVKDLAGTAKIYEDRCKYLDQQLSKIVLGGTTTVDAVSGGHAVSQEHEKVRHDIERDDARALSATLTRQLVPLIIKANFGPQQKYPRIRIGRPDELPIKDVVDAIDKLGPKGLTVTAAELRRRLGMPDPAPGEDLVGTPAVVPVAEPPKAQDSPGNGKAPMMQALNALQTRKGPEPFDAVERLATRLAQDASGALGGMTDQVRHELEQATSLEDAAVRLATLQLGSHDFALALARAMAIAHLAGQASILDSTGDA